MRSQKKRDEKTIATLELIVDFEDVPDESVYDEILEKCREQGGIRKAILTIHRATRKTLV